MAGISTFFGIQTALRGLLAQQRGLDVTGHNVANANTVGYSRQEAALGASAALELDAGGIASGGEAQIGTGVDVQQYRRIRDIFLDIQYRAQATRVGEETQNAKSLDQAELAFAEPGENGIADRLSKLWSAFAGVANSPEASKPAARQALVEQARLLGTAFASLDAQLATVATQAGAEYASITAPTGDVQSIANEIAGLNQSISAAVGSGAQPNDLMDRRDHLLDQLSELGQVSVQELGTG